jgi:Fur family ferric uptake transcriptional regulator
MSSQPAEKTRDAAKAANSAPWAEHALTTLQEAGHRRGGARTAVVEALAAHDCAVTALDLDDEMRQRSPRVGRASVYRALEQLEQLGLVRRIEVSRGVAGYERVDPTGHHHHHAICRDCGRMVPFEDPRLERALEHVAGEMPGFDVAEHDVVLRGRCDRCAN